MKAEIIQTEHGTSLQITALTTQDQEVLKAFMDATKRVRKPKLRILKSPDHDRILNIGFVTYVRQIDFKDIETDNANITMDNLFNFPNYMTKNELTVKGFIRHGNDKLYVGIDGTNFDRPFLAFIHSDGTTWHFLGKIFTLADIDRLKLKFKKIHGKY